MNSIGIVAVVYVGVKISGATILLNFRSLVSPSQMSVADNRILPDNGLAWDSCCGVHVRENLWRNNVPKYYPQL